AAQSQTDFMNAMDIVGSMQYCDVLQPGFKDATGVQYAAWRASHQASVAAVESLPQFKARPAVTEASVTPQQRAAYSKKCPCLQRYFTRVHPDPKFATPEKVWAEYLSSLRSGQPEAAMDCLVDSALENLSDIIETQSPDFLR